MIQSAKVELIRTEVNSINSLLTKSRFLSSGDFGISISLEYTVTGGFI